MSTTSQRISQLQELEYATGAKLLYYYSPERNIVVFSGVSDCRCISQDINTTNGAVLILHAIARTISKKVDELTFYELVNDISFPFRMGIYQYQRIKIQSVIDRSEPRKKRKPSRRKIVATMKTMVAPQDIVKIFSPKIRLWQPATARKNWVGKSGKEAWKLK